MHENGKLSNVIMWSFRFGAVYIHSHIKQSHQSQFKKIILSETPCRYGTCYLTRAPLVGGGAISSPPLIFLRYLLNQCRYHHQTCSTLSPPNIFTHCVKILKSRVSWFGHKWRQSDVMFRRFRPKIRVYGNRRHECSFKATINFLI